MTERWAREGTKARTKAEPGSGPGRRESAGGAADGGSEIVDGHGCRQPLQSRQRKAFLRGQVGFGDDVEQPLIGDRDDRRWGW